MPTLSQNFFLHLKTTAVIPVRLKTFLPIFIFIILAINLQPFTVQGKDYYRTFEIIAITENGLSLKDNDGNIIIVDKAPGDYKVGYKVRYDSVRNRLKPYRWQDYTIETLTGNVVTLRHKTGDILTVAGNFTRKYQTGDLVRYDSIGDKLQPFDELDQWQQYTVIRSESDRIIIRNKSGREINLTLDNNLYQVSRGLFMPHYKVGEQVRFNRSTNQLRKGEIRTYDWQDYKVNAITTDTLVLRNGTGEELVLKNIWGRDFVVGEPVKYDRLNKLLKKAR